MFFRCFFGRCFSRSLLCRNPLSLCPRRSLFLCDNLLNLGLLLLNQCCVIIRHLLSIGNFIVTVCRTCTLGINRSLQVCLLGLLLLLHPFKFSFFLLITVFQFLYFCNGICIFVQTFSVVCIHFLCVLSIVKKVSQTL